MDRGPGTEVKVIGIGAVYGCRWMTPESHSFSGNVKITGVKGQLQYLQGLWFDLDKTYYVYVLVGLPKNFRLGTNLAKVKIVGIKFRSDIDRTL